MRDIFVLVEHRRGEIGDITFQMLTKGRELAQKTNSKLVAVLLGKDVKRYVNILSKYAESVMVVENVELEYFNSELYQIVLSDLVKRMKPLLVLIGHTSYGIELAPSLAVSLNVPLATDCIDIEFKDGIVYITRQMYEGKVNVKASLKRSETYMVTIRRGAFKAKEVQLNGEVVEIPFPLSKKSVKKRFVDYLVPPPGEVDISSADVIVAVGRGIKDRNNIAIAEELAKSLGGVLACSRPIVDNGWLPSDRQVGISGKTVKPKLYIALGISGAFQHIVGMKDSEIKIAINRDPNAPIFNVADYGVVDDIFRIVPHLIQKLKNINVRDEIT